MAISHSADDGHVGGLWAPQERTRTSPCTRLTDDTCQGLTAAPSRQGGFPRDLAAPSRGGLHHRHDAGEHHLTHSIPILDGDGLAGIVHQASVWGITVAASTPRHPAGRIRSRQLDRFTGAKKEASERAGFRDRSTEPIPLYRRGTSRNSTHSAPDLLVGSRLRR
jgi:hypothetical protein